VEWVREFMQQHKAMGESKETIAAQLQEMGITPDDLE
jgi:hypothetical protein